MRRRTFKIISNLFKYMVNIFGSVSHFAEQYGTKKKSGKMLKLHLGTKVCMWNGREMHDSEHEDCSLN